MIPLEHLNFQASGGCETQTNCVKEDAQSLDEGGAFFTTEIIGKLGGTNQDRSKRIIKI